MRGHPRTLEAEVVTRRTYIAELREQFAGLEAQQADIAQRLARQLVAWAKLRVRLLVGLLTGAMGWHAVRDRPAWKGADRPGLLARARRGAARAVRLGSFLLRLGLMLALYALLPGVRRTLSATGAPLPVGSTAAP